MSDDTDSANLLNRIAASRRSENYNERTMVDVPTQVAERLLARLAVAEASALEEHKRFLTYQDRCMAAEADLAIVQRALVDVTNSLGNGSFASTNSSAAFLAHVPEEVASVVGGLRKQRDAAEAALGEVSEFIRIDHLDMGGNHRYCLRRNGKPLREFMERVSAVLDDRARGQQ